MELSSPVAYGPRHALVVVDVQNDFADPAGSLSVAGAGDVVLHANREIARARAGGAQVAYSRDWHPARTAHFAIDGGPWPVHCVAGSWGARFHPRLVVLDDALQIRKGANGEDGYSAFTMRDPATGADVPTPLTAALRRRGVEHVVVIGLATDYCVRATALDSVRAGFPTTVVRAAVAAVDVEPGDGDRALAELAEAGVVLA